MDLLILIALLVLIWVAWSVLRSYRNMESELRQIRKKCFSEGGSSSSEDVPKQKVTEGMVSGLRSLLSMAT